MWQARSSRRLLLASLLATAAAVSLSAQQPSPHVFFDALVARADHYVSYSLRDKSQLDRYATNLPNESVLYEPSYDTEPNAQDAAKIVIPAFRPVPTAQLHTAIDTAALVVPLESPGGSTTSVSTSYNGKSRQLRIGDEVVITDPTDPFDRYTGILKLSKRGAYGTTAKSHPVGEPVYESNNSLRNQIRLPVGTSDGSTWFFTWDAYFTASYLNNGIGNFKAFQLSSPSNDIWFEPQTDFSGDGAPGFSPSNHVAVARFRSYNRVGGLLPWVGGYLGPGVTDNNPISPTAMSPQSARFLIHPNRWTRWFVRIRQQANDYDILDAWLADEQQGPVLVLNQIPVSVSSENGVSTIDKFYLEFNTSTVPLPAGRTTDFRDLVAYARNFVVLQDPPSDLGGLLQRPGATVPLPPPITRLRSPRNLRLAQP